MIVWSRWPMCVGLSPNMWPNNGDVGQMSNEPKKNNLVFVFGVWAQRETCGENTACQRFNLISFSCRHKNIQGCATCVLPWLRAWFPCGDAHRRGADSQRFILQKYWKSYCPFSKIIVMWCFVPHGMSSFWDRCSNSSLCCKSAPEDTPVREIRYLSFNSATLLAQNSITALGMTIFSALV